MPQLNLFAQQPDDDDDFQMPAAQVRTRPRLTPVPAPQPTPSTPGPAPTAKPALRRYPVPCNLRPQQTAQRIAEAAVDAWHRHHGGGRMEIPVGVVAALSLWPRKGPDAPLQADFMLGLDAADLVQLMRECWAYWWMRRPHLVNRAAPIASWMEEDLSSHELTCVKAVAHAAITNSLLVVTGSMDPYDLAECDLMSWMVTGLRSRGSQKWLGEFHTPPEICELMARLELGDCSQVEPGFSFLEPAGGTGGMLRAAAQHLREHKIDPATCRWHLTEIDPIAAAGAAVNMMLWGMGQNATVWCGDSLAPVDTARLALEEKAGIFEHRDRVESAMAMAFAIGQAERLIAGVTAERAA
ncbi:N-6 DNA methylase [Kitasatospora sp. NBC_01287]|uniref:N-6 DNA methylase n=1 Tax=Kitasatospora sp. NBC_01287 TaxID=2903573 RepID=UPI0022503B7E|nr:N-6 DNA methylase [Kitasatospora sp. NBC_01287]MCX4749280.1 N-6 DNA methylase [Kitasatospora sp. NBC_01287]